MVTALASERIIPEQTVDEWDRQLGQKVYDEEEAFVQDLETELTYKALTKVLGHNKHRERDVPRKARAEIIGSGIAGISDDPGGNLASLTNRTTGTMIIAEGTGSQVGVEATVLGFERAMQGEKTAKATVNSAVKQMRQALQGTVPAVIKETQSQLGGQARETAATALAVQIVDDTIVYKSTRAGDRPLYVYNETTGTCKRLIYPDVDGEGIHTLEPGRNIIIMSSGRATDEGIPSPGVIADVLKETAENPEYRSSDNEATRIAETLHATFSTDAAAGAVMVNIAEVAEWKDKRPALIQKLDWAVRAPSSLVYLAISNTMSKNQAKRDEILGRTSRSKSRREVYETNTDTGKGGRIAARVGDVITDAAFVWVAFSLTRSVLTAAGIDIFGHHGGNTTPNTHHPFTEPPGPGGSGGGPDTTPHKEAFPASYHALWQDPENNSSQSNVTNISRQTLEFYGKQTGLPEADIHKMTHDEALIGRLNQAFMHDTHNSHNKDVLNNSRHWLYAGKTYSTHDVSALAQKVTAAEAHKLGLDTAQAPAASPSGPSTVASATPPAVESSQPATVLASPDTAVSAAAAPIGSIPEGYDSNGHHVWRNLGIVATAVAIASVGSAGVRAIIHKSRVATAKEIEAYDRMLQAYGKKPRKPKVTTEAAPKKSIIGRFRDRRDTAARRKEGDRSAW